MEHLQNYISKQKQEVFKDCTGITVSLKIDGTPLQLEVTDNQAMKFKFNSKPSSSLDKPGPTLTSTDLFMNPAFYDQVTRIRETILSGKADQYLSYLHLLNFEIVVDNKHHIIQYQDKPNGNMFLLSATSTNGKFISKGVLSIVAKTFGLSIVPSKDYQKDTLDKLIEFSKDSFKYSNQGYVAGLYRILGDGIVNPHMEGIVIQIHGGQKDGMMLKIDSPEFINTFKDRKNQKLSEDEEKDIRGILAVALETVDKSKINKWSNDPLENMIENYEKSLVANQQNWKRFVDKCKASSKSQRNAIDRAIPPKYQDKIKGTQGQDWVLGLQNFIWLFRKQRKGLLKDANEIVALINSGKS